MATTYYITHRRMQSSRYGTHEHVGWVKLLDGSVLSRDDVFTLMARGVLFRTYAASGHGANVIRVRCDRCQYDYLRTDRDWYADDNLDELPKF